MIKIGNVCECERGRLGIISDIQYGLDNRPTEQATYLGIAFDGSKWISIRPKKVAENINGYLTTILRH